jgi:hypothetical protein
MRLPEAAAKKAAAHSDRTPPTDCLRTNRFGIATREDRSRLGRKTFRRSSISTTAPAARIVMLHEVFQFHAHCPATDNVFKFQAPGREILHMARLPFIESLEKVAPTGQILDMLTQRGASMGMTFKR